MGMDQDDDTLAALLATNVRRHFQRVVEVYQHRLYAFAFRLTGQAQAAEDIVQEAFVRAYVACSAYPAERVQTLKLQAWLYRITLNECRHSTRGAQLHIVPLDLADDSAALDIEGAAEERPEQLLELRERRRELEAAITHLPERYRVPLLCVYFENLSYQETAELLDQPVGTIKSAVSRGVRLLRAYLTSAPNTCDTDAPPESPTDDRQEQSDQRGKEGEPWDLTMTRNSRLRQA